MPDQTTIQAMERVYRPEASLGPTLLSLACDNRKFIVERDGTMVFDNDPAVYNHFADANLPHSYATRITPRLGSGTQPVATRRLEQGYLPLVTAETVDGQVRYRQRTFVAPVDDEQADSGSPLWRRDKPLGVAEFRAANLGDTTASVTMTFAIADGEPAGHPVEVTVDGRIAVATQDGALLALVESIGGILELSTDAQYLLRAEGRLPADSESGCVVYMPRWNDAGLEQVPLSSVEMLASRTVEYWRRVTGEGMQVEVPDPLFTNLIPASQIHCLLAARNEDGVNIAPWIGSVNYGPLESEAHSVLRGMAFTGHEDFTRRGLDYFIKRYNDKGFLTTGYTVMGTGWHLWTLGEFYRLTKDRVWLRRHAPEVARICRWVMAEREKTKRLDDRGEKVPEYGLMPPGAMADWEVFNYYFYMNGYYHAGLAAAGEALADLGWPEAEIIVKNASEFRDDILRAFHSVQSQAPVYPLRDGTWVPSYPTHLLSPAPIENLYAGEDFGRSWAYDVELGAHHLVPQGVLPADSKEAGWIMDHMEDVQFLRDGWFYYPAEASQSDWFNLGGFAKVQPYYARTGEVYAMRDDVKPFIRTYFNSAISLLNREDLSLWEHFMNGAYNKTHETGYFLHQTRLMLVQERGDELWLAPFIPSNWFRDGMRITVSNAPTFFGKVSYTIDSHLKKSYIDVSVLPPTRQLPKSVVVRLRHPEGRLISGVEMSGAHSVAVDGDLVRLVTGGETIKFRAIYGGQ